MSHHPALFTWLLTGITWAALFAVCYLSRPLYRQRPSVPVPEPGSPEPGSPDVVDVAEFITDTPAFDSPYAVSPHGPAGDEQ